MLGLVRGLAGARRAERFEERGAKSVGGEEAVEIGAHDAAVGADGALGLAVDGREGPRQYRRRWCSPCACGSR